MNIEEELRRSEERYRLLVESSGIGVGYFNLDGKILFFNSKAAQNMGGKPEDYTGRSLHELFGKETGDAYLKRIRAAVESKECIEFEDYIILPTGSFWFLSHYTRVQNSNGIVEGVQIISYDITNRKIAEEKLRISEERFRLLSFLEPVGIYLTDADGNCIYTNKKWNELTGLTNEQALGAGWVKGLHPDDRDLVFANWQKMIDSKGLWGFDYRFMTPEGKISWVHGLAVPQVDHSNHIINYIGVNIDITQQRETEKALRESEEKYKKLVDMSPDAIVIHSGGIIVFANKTCLDLTGARSENELIGKPAIDFVHPDYRELAMQRIRDIYSYSTKAELAYEKFLTLNGDVMDVETTAIPFVYNGKPSIQLIIRDVSQRKRMEEAKEKSEAQYRLLADNMNDMVWLMDLHLNTTYISPSVEKLRGFTLEELKSTPLMERMAQESYQQLMALYDEEMPKILSDPDYTYMDTIDMELYHKDGSSYWLEIVFNIIRDEKGVPVSVLCVGRDITQHRIMSHKLKEGEERLNLFFSQSLDGFFFMLLDEPVTWNETADKEKLIEYAMHNLKLTKINQAMLDQYGATEDQFIGRTITEFFYHDPGQGKEIVRELFANGHIHAETREKRLDGKDIIIDGDYIGIHDPENRITGLFGIQRDISERKQDEIKIKHQLEELQRWQMVTLGREDRNQELKREVNDLLHRLGEPVRYPSQEKTIPATDNENKS